MELGDNKNSGAVKKRGPNKATASKAGSSTKRKRSELDLEAAHESEISDDGMHEVKKLKSDAEDDKSVKVEAEEA